MKRIFTDFFKEIDDIVSLNNLKPSNSKKFDCFACSKGHSSYDELEDHIEKEHGRRVWIQHQRMVSPQRPIVCLNCSFGFKNQIDYKAHIDIKHCELFQIEVHWVGLKEMPGCHVVPDGIITPGCSILVCFQLVCLFIYFIFSYLIRNRLKIVKTKVQIAIRTKKEEWLEKVSQPRI